MELSRQEYWSELPFPPSEDIPNPEFKSMSHVSPALADRFSTTEPAGKAQTSFRFPIIPSFRRSYQDGVWDRAWGKDLRGRCTFFRHIQKPSMATDSSWTGMLFQLPLLWTPQLTTWFLWPSVSPSITKGYVLLFPAKWIGTDDSCEMALIRLHQSGVKLLGFESYLHRLLASPLTSVALGTLLNHSVLCFPRLSRGYGVLVRIRWAHKYKALRSLCGRQ